MAIQLSIHSWVCYIITCRKDSSSSSSIDLLKTAGLDFDKHKTIGINPFLFGELMFTYGIFILRIGLVLNSELHWISFQGNYDFAYFLKLVTCETLPDNEADFQDKLQTYFPNYYDVKCLLKDSSIPSGSLSKISSNFGVYL